MYKLCLSLVIGVGITYAAKEIELKISVSADKYPEIEYWLKHHASHLGVSQQKEWYLRNPHESLDYSGGFKDTLRTMRIRQEAAGDSLCYKYRHLDPITRKTTHRDEYEVRVAEGATVLEILKLLGYTEQTIVYKKRRTYLVKDIFEVVIDEVETCGIFIEVELKERIDDVRAGREKIEGLLREMGIVSFIEYDRGYIHMIWNPGYNFGVVRNL